MSSSIKRPSCFARQPAKATYVLWTVLCSLTKLPMILILYSRQSTRPNRNWSFKQAFVNEVVKTVLDCVAVTETKTPQITRKSVTTGDYTLLEPADPTYYRERLKDPAIKPLPVGADWVPSAYSKERDADKSICLHFHGGAFITLSPSSPNAQWGPRNIANELEAPVLIVDYRLSCNLDSRFPAALQDAVTAYKHLLSEGIPSTRIFLSGDSAGGNLVLALLRYIAEEQTIGSDLLPSPAGAMLWSTWVDMSRDPRSFDYHVNACSDYVTPSLVAWGIREYVPDSESISGPYFSPLKHPFRTETKLFVQAGTSEVQIDDIRDFTKEMKHVPGNRIRYHEIADGVHDVFASGGDLDFQPQAVDAVRQSIAFFSET
ncbi:MAG: hypothetical protein M1828_007329 [Chrysothrix sp. TS-e1954]|nr:MAG: hypothetical protein M1828_007329 [Chrysothrix sp. TS-e1954]